MKIKRVAGVYLLLALVLGAMVPVMLKVATQRISIYEYIMLTYMVGLPASLLFVFLRRKEKRLAQSMLNLKEFLFIAMLGLLGYTALEYGLAFAETYVSASLATVVYRTAPLLMLIFMPIMLRERVTKYQIAALMLGFAGIYIAFIGGGIAVLGSANIAIIAFVVLLALAGAYYAVAIKRYSFDMDISVFVFNLAGFLVSILLFAASGTQMQALNMPSIFAILFVGVVYNVIVGLMYAWALRMSKTSFVANIYFLSPFITFIYAWLILGESIYLYYIEIAILVSAGILIQRLDKKGGSYLSKIKGGNTIHDVTGAFVNTEVPLIYNAIRTGGRVLAMKLDVQPDNVAGRHIKRRINGKQVIIYSHNNKKLVDNDQREFIVDIMGIKGNESVIMGAGDTLASETALHEIEHSIAK